MFVVVVGHLHFHWPFSWRSIDRLSVSFAESSHHRLVLATVVKVSQKVCLLSLASSVVGVVVLVVASLLLLLNRRPFHSLQFATNTRSSIVAAAASLHFRREGEGALRFVTLYRDRFDYAPRATRSPEFLDQGHSGRAQTRAYLR